jgi:predicted permease
METLLRSLRALRSQPRFAGAVVAALGVGLGANAALFSVVSSLLLRPLPHRRPEELVDISMPGGRAALDALRQARSFVAVAGYGPRGFGIAGPDGVRNVYGHRVTANLFSVLGVEPVLGRAFRADEDTQPLVMLGYEYWRRTSGDPQLIGRTLVLDERPHTIVGVLPADYWLWTRDANLFVPGLPDDHRLVARLRRGVSPAAAAVELAAIVGELPRDAVRPAVTPLARAFRSSEAPSVLLLQASVALVLLILCANVGNLLLVRASARRRELAIRTALGGTPRQLLAQLVGESLILAALGAALGLLLGHWSLASLHALLPANIARALRGSEALSIDARVLAFTTCLSLLTVVVSGIVPARGALRFDVLEALRDSGRGAALGRQRLGSVLVAAEIALALTLSIAAGVLAKNLLRLQSASLGFSPEGVLRAAVELPASRYAAEQPRANAFARLLERVAALPGVQAAGAVAPQLFPFGGPRVRGARFEIQGRPDAEYRAEVYSATPAYFAAVRIPLLAGRLFTERDGAAAPPVALLSSVVARRYWGAADPLGRVIRLESQRRDSPWVTVVGVVGDVRNPAALDEQPTAYRPFAQRPYVGATLMIKTAGDALALGDAVRREVRALEPAAPETRIADLERHVRSYVSPQRFTTSLIGSFALVGLLLAALGIYAVTRAWVAARVPELGMRVALGAQRRDVLTLVLVSAGRAVLAGVVLGIAGALALQRVLAAQLHGVSPSDPAVMAGVCVLAVVLALVAALGPALRAAKIDVLAALRHE